MPLPEQVIEMSELTVWGVGWESCQQCELIGVMDGDPPASLSPPLSYGGLAEELVSPSHHPLVSFEIALCPQSPTPGLMRLALLIRASTETTKQNSTHSQCVFL